MVVRYCIIEHDTMAVGMRKKGKVVDDNVYDGRMGTEDRQKG